MKNLLKVIFVLFVVFIFFVNISFPKSIVSKKMSLVLSNVLTIIYPLYFKVLSFYYIINTKFFHLVWENKQKKWLKSFDCINQFLWITLLKFKKYKSYKNNLERSLSLLNFFERAFKLTKIAPPIKTTIR